MHRTSAFRTLSSPTQIPNKVGTVHILRFMDSHLTSRASLVAQSVKNLPAMQETWVRPLAGQFPWRRKWQPTPVSLPGDPMGRPWRVTVHGVARSDAVKPPPLHLTSDQGEATLCLPPIPITLFCAAQSGGYFSKHLN